MEQTKDNITTEEILLSDGDLTAIADPFGARIKQLCYKGTAVGRDGITVGRYANRIKDAKLWIKGKCFELSANEDGNCLHGGAEGFDRRTWDCTLIENTCSKGAEAAPNRAEFCLVSKDGDQGFPGRLQVIVRYTLSENSLIIDYEAVSDSDTVINLTNHTYFNLNGKGSPEDHILKIDAESITQTGPGLIPTGRFIKVFGTRFDYTSPRQFQGPHDENYVLCGEGFRKAACLIGTQSGIRMEVLTDQPGLQLYNTEDAVCLETQHFPDSPNHPEFPATLLEAGTVFRSRTAYKFSQNT